MENEEVFAEGCDDSLSFFSTFCLLKREERGRKKIYSLSTLIRYLVDPASSDMLVSKIKPCTCQYKLLYGETANGSLNQL